MMGELVYIKVYKDFISIAEALDNGQRGRLFLAILQYANGQEVTPLQGAEYIAFLTIKAQIDRDQSEYASRTEKNRENGRKGGRPKKANGFSENQTVFEKTQKSQDKEKDKEEDKEKEKEDIPPISPQGERKRFAPPTLQEVSAYCRDRQNDVDPQRFIDYYSSNGWKVGKNPMKDWRAAVRTWERNDEGRQDRGFAGNTSSGSPRRDWGDLKGVPLD